MEQQNAQAPASYGRIKLSASAPHIVGMEHHEDGKITYTIEALGQRLYFTANQQEQALYAAGYNSGELAGASNMQAHYEAILREMRPADESVLRDQFASVEARYAEANKELHVKLDAAEQRAKTYKQWADERAEQLALVATALFEAGFKGESELEQARAAIEQAMFAEAFMELNRKLQECIHEASAGLVALGADEAGTFQEKLRQIGLLLDSAQGKVKLQHETLTSMAKTIHNAGLLQPGIMLDGVVAAICQEVRTLRSICVDLNERASKNETARFAAEHRAELMKRSNQGIAAEATALRKSEEYYREQFEIWDGRLAAALMYADSLGDILVDELGDQLYASSGASKLLDELKRLLNGATQLSGDGAVPC